MSTRSSYSNLVPPFIDPESVIRARRRNLGDPSRLLDFEEINMNPNNVQGPPPAGPPPQNHNGPPGLNLQMPAPDLRTMEELCQPTMNGQGGPIAPVNIQATDFGLKNHMIQQVQDSCQFHGLPGDDANKHLDKFLTITQSMKQNGVTDDALRLYLFPYSLTHHATAWFDRLPKNSIHTFQEMATKFLSKFFPPSMVTKLRNDISNFRQLPDKSLFEAWEHYKLSIDRCPNHNMLLVTQIDMFYNGLTLRHRDTINAAAGGTFMKRKPKECYDIIENITAHHNDWDTSAHRGESSSSATSSSFEIAALAQQMIEMRKDMFQMYRSNQQVNFVTPNCETCGGPHSYYECQAAGGYTQDVYATTGNYSPGAGSSVPPLPSSSSSSSKEVERDPKMITDRVLTESTTRVPPPIVQPSPISRPYEIPPPPTSSSSKLPKWNPHQPPIPYLSRLNKEKLQDKSDIQVHKFFQMFKKLHFNISLAEALALMPKYHKMLKDLLSDKEKLLGLANTSLTKNCSAVLLKKLPEKLGDPGKFLIPCDFPELEKCMALADLGASINLMPLSVWKKLMLPELVPTRMTLELANRSIAYPAGIAEDVFVQVGKFTFPADFVVVDYDVDPRVPLILGRPFLRTARALVDVYGEELILRDGDEKLIFHADSTSKHPHKHGNESINMINFIDISCKDRFQEVLKIMKSNHPLSGSLSLSSDPVTSDSLLEEFTDELALLDPFPSGNEDDNFDPEADLKEIEYLLNRDPSTDSSPTTDIDINDLILETFTDEPALVYSSPPGNDDDEDDDLFDLKSDNDEWKKLSYGDSYIDIHSKNDKTKDSKMKILINELETPKSNVLLPHLLDCDLTFHEELPDIDTLTSFPFENKDKVFNPGILIHGSTHFVTNPVTQDKNFKKKTSSEAPLILEERNIMSIPSDCELTFHYELPETQTLLSFSSENKDKVFNPGILISKGVHSLTLGLSHRNYEAFKIINVYPNILNGSSMKIFPFFYFYYGGDISSLDVPYLHLYLP
ncbi:reverse transcriptase domain-containing protein [Tanacetum coccineum]